MLLMENQAVLIVQEASIWRLWEQHHVNSVQQARFQQLWQQQQVQHVKTVQQARFLRQVPVSVYFARLASTIQILDYQSV